MQPKRVLTLISFGTILVACLVTLNLHFILPIFVDRTTAPRSSSSSLSSIPSPRQSSPLANQRGVRKSNHLHRGSAAAATSTIEPLLQADASSASVFDDDHISNFLLTITDAPHIAMSLITVGVKSYALDYYNKRKHFVQEQQLQQQPLSTTTTMIVTTKVKQHQNIVITLLTAFISITIGFVLQTFVDVDILYIPLSYFAILHTICQIVWIIQMACYFEESSSTSEENHQTTSTANVEDEQQIEEEDEDKIYGKPFNPNRHHFWWSFSLIRPRGLDAVVALTLCLSSVAIWFMDIDRGLDWFHWELLHDIAVPRSALPFYLAIFAIGFSFQLYRMVQHSRKVFWNHSHETSSSSENENSFFGVASKKKDENNDDDSTISSRNVVTVEIQQSPALVTPITSFETLQKQPKWMKRLACIKTSSLGHFVAFPSCAIFCLAIVKPDRDVSLPLLAIPHSFFAVCCYAFILFRSFNKLLGWSVAVSVKTVISIVIGCLVWGVIDRLLVDNFVLEPNLMSSFTLYAVPQILHLVLDPLRSAWLWGWTTNI